MTSPTVLIIIHNKTHIVSFIETNVTPPLRLGEVARIDGGVDYWIEVFNMFLSTPPPFGHPL